MTFLGNWFPTLSPEYQLGAVGANDFSDIIFLPINEVIAFQWLAKTAEITVGCNFHFGGTLSGDPLTAQDVTLSPTLVSTVSRGGGLLETDDVVTLLAATTEARAFILTSGSQTVSGTHRFYSDPADPATMVTDYTFDWAVLLGVNFGTSGPDTFQGYLGGLESHALRSVASISFKYKFDGTGSFITGSNNFSSDNRSANTNPSRGTFNVSSFDGTNPIDFSVNMKYLGIGSDSGFTDFALSSATVDVEITENLTIST